MKKQLLGTVISDSMDKTRVVVVNVLKKHPLYNKQVKSRRRFFVHDEQNKSHVGDIVEIQETRPLSRKKAWKVISVKEGGTN